MSPTFGVQVVLSVYADLANFTQEGLIDLPAPSALIPNGLGQDTKALRV